MAKTITTHNGTAAHREHNVRNPKVTGKQDHINPELIDRNETLHDEKPREAYQRIFGEALEAYNQKQKRDDRKISDYFTHVLKDKKKNAVYEMIVQIGDRNDTGVDAPVERECLREFYAGWAERNPNLECIGAYIHADEEEGTLHMHLDYVPVATGYKKGMEIQNGLAKALEQQGFTKDGKLTAQIQWEARENAALESICERHGIEIIHPTTEKRKHMSTQEYKAWQSVQLALETKENLETEIGVLQEALQEAKDALQQAKTEREMTLLNSREIAQKAAEAVQKTRKLDQAVKGLEQRKDSLETTVAVLESREDEIRQALPEMESKIDAARDELETVERAVKKKKAEGQALFGGHEEMTRSIQQQKEQMEKEKKLSLLDKFLEWPPGRAIWEQFMQMISRNRSRSKPKEKNPLQK